MNEVTPSVVEVHRGGYKSGRAGRVTVKQRRTFEQLWADEKYQRELAEIEIKELRKRVRSFQQEAIKLRRLNRTMAKATTIKRMQKALDLAGIPWKEVIKDGANVRQIVNDSISHPGNRRVPPHGEGGKGGGAKVVDLRPD